jgi:lipopolysaccharide transport system permease protein
MVEEGNNKQWSKVISAKKKWWDIDLKGVLDYKGLIFSLVKRDLVSIYKQTILGPIWFLFGPLFTVFTYTFAFSTIAHIPTDGIPAPVFYLAGTVLWNYFQACLNGSSATFLSNAHLFGKVYFPRIIPSIALIISNLMKMLLQFIVFVVFCFYYQTEGKLEMNGYVVLFPVLVLLMAILSLGFGLIISSVSVKYRDMNQLIGVFVTLLMYASPIIYPSSSVPSLLKPYISLNPIVPLINTFRYGFTGAGSFEWSGILYTFIFSILTLFIGLVMFHRVEKTFIDTI